MTPSDLALLVVLGVADRGPTSLQRIVETARTIAPMDWQPTTDALQATAERAINGGLAVVELAPSEVAKLRTTPLGRTQMTELLRQPMPQLTGGFVRTCMAVKLCFLDYLPLPERSEHADELASLYRDAVGFADILTRLPLTASAPARDGLRGEALRIDSELAWLNAMTAWQPLRHAAE